MKKESRVRLLKGLVAFCVVIGLYALADIYFGIGKYLEPTYISVGKNFWE